MLPEDKDKTSRLKEISELLITTYRYHIAAALVVLLVLGGIVLFFKGFFSGTEGKVEILSATSSAEVKGVSAASVTSTQEIVVEISGEVQNPGVYHFSSGARIDDLIDQAGGVTDNADSEWLSKKLNRAAKLTDGLKLYIPKVKEIKVEVPVYQDTTVSAKDPSTPTTESISRTIISEPSNSLININSASLKDLDVLPGIGQVYAQKIIDHRPYSDIGELKSKKVVPSATYEKIKEKISI